MSVSRGTESRGGDGPLVRSGEVGRTLSAGEGRSIGSRAISRSRSTERQSREVGESFVDTTVRQYAETHFGSRLADEVVEKINKIAKENYSAEEYAGTQRQFAEEVIAPNWYARMLATDEIVEKHGFMPVDVDTTDLDKTMWFAVTTSGSYYLFGPKTLFGSESRTDGDEENGLFAFEFIEGRKTGVLLSSGDKMPDATSLEEPNTKARVRIGRNGVLPVSGTSLHISSYTPEGERKSQETSHILKAYYLPGETSAQRAKELFSLFSGASREINEEAIDPTADLGERATREVPTPTSSRSRSRGKE